MKKAILFITILFSNLSLYAQFGAGDDFESGTLSTDWTNIPLTGTPYKGYIKNYQGTNILYINYKTVDYSSTGFSYSFSPINIETAPFVTIDVNADVSTNFVLRIDLLDENGNRTNKYTTKQTIVGKGINITTNYLFDFREKFYQSVPNSANVDPTKITKMIFTVNPDAPSTTGTFLLDNVMIGTRAKTTIKIGAKEIKLNQLGFFTNGSKKAVINKNLKGNYYIVNAVTKDTVFTGILSDTSIWSMSKEIVTIADFTAFKQKGTFIIRIPGIGLASYPFTISDNPLNAISKASIKGFYYQRASMALTPEFAGTWSRAAGHPDNQVYIHNSAISPGRPDGFKISAPRGWYDAGDYNKYIVNSGISTYTLLACYEHFSNYYDTLALNIPESTNDIPDVLDEALYNIRWMLTMQDPYDGGVYHKLTNENFDGTVMPSNATNRRYVVQKSTPATLDFAAVMAQASRIYSRFSLQLPGLSDSCLKAAKYAYDWSILNPSMYYEQSQLSNPSISTGEYGDYSKDDEQNWAASELYITTRLEKYRTDINLNTYLDIPGWQNVNTLGFISLAHNRVLLGKNIDSTLIKDKIILLAESFRKEASTNSAYRIAIGANVWNFSWGSNSGAANQSMILIQAFNYTKDSTYLTAALSNIDYLLGRNGLNNSFVTGYGSSFSNNPHHRISQADGIAQAVPGLLVGGPNKDAPQQDKCSGYPSKEPALSYLDTDCSYASNEIAINWNAPLAYITGAVQSIFSGIEPTAIDYNSNPTSIKSNQLKNTLVKIYPNPANNLINVEKPFALISSPTIVDLNGIEYTVTTDWSNTTFQINTSHLSEGLYLIRLQGENGVAFQKFTILK